MNRKQLAIQIPSSAIEEFEDIEEMDWSEGILLHELLDWINELAARFRPAEIGDGSRASRDFTPRTFRHYQTLGCIDAPKRRGKQAIYSFRHYVQAMLLRKLIWERVPSEKIADLIAGRGSEELKQMLFEGVEFIAHESRKLARPESSNTGDDWKHVRIVPGLELHIRGDLQKPDSALIGQWVASVESALRENL